MKIRQVIVTFISLSAASVLTLTIPPIQRAQAFPEAILKEFGNRLTDKICEDGGKWLQCYRLEASSCSKVIGELVAKCTSLALGSVTETLSNAEGMAKAQQMNSCINQNFLSSYGFQKVSSPECAQPPAHLQDPQ